MLLAPNPSIQLQPRTLNPKPGWKEVFKHKTYRQVPEVPGDNAARYFDVVSGLPSLLSCQAQGLLVFMGVRVRV